MASKLDMGIYLRLSEASARSSVEGDETVEAGPLSLDVPCGEFLSIIGPSSRVNSLVLHMIAGLEPLRTGSIDFIATEGATPGSVGFVFRKASLLPWRSVLSNVLLEAELQRLDLRTFGQRARRLLATMSLTDCEDLMPHELRFEEAQRVAICRALLNSPSLLLLDDPFSHMELAAREHAVSDVQRLWMEYHFAAVLSTADISEAVQLSDRILLMSQTPARILQKLEINLPRPRRLDKATTPQITDYCSQIRTIFRAQGLPC